MANVSIKNRLYLFFLIYFTTALLALALPGSSAFLIKEKYSNNDLQNSAGHFSSLGYTVDWLAESITIAGRANKNSSSALRNGLARVIITLGACTGALLFTGLCFQAIKKDNITQKNKIHLILRI